MSGAKPTLGERGGAEAGLRFDDMLATVLAQPLSDAVARTVAWRQVVDLLAQRRAEGDDPVRDEAYDLLRAARGEVPAERRRDVARSLVGRRLPAELVAFFAEEPSSIAEPLIAAVRLDDAEWIALLPTFTPPIRGILRNRRDLTPEVERALASFGASDLVLAGPKGSVPAAAAGPDLDPAPSPSSSEGEVQIRELMARIDAFRRTVPAAEELLAEEEEASVTGDCFRFETGADGVILWVEDAPRGPLIGLTIAVAADRVDHGVDGHAAGAYRQRAPFRDARLAVAGAGSAAGEWRISGVPFFDPVDGRFTGYRGTARRPRIDETAVASVAGAALYGAGLPPDSLRQLVHELRTPLNAIVGFAEMIERQLLGPAAREYRTRAGEIIAQGRRLLATVDDLDVSARLETQRVSFEPGPVDAALLLARLRPDYDRIAVAHGVSIEVAIPAGLPAVDGDPVAVERMFARLLAATVGLAAPGERIGIRLGNAADGDLPTVSLTVTRPRLLAGRDERALLDPGYSPDGDWPDAPVLGLGFALRLVRNLAAAARGRLEIEGEAFVLRLPARKDSQASGQGRG